MRRTTVTVLLLVTIVTATACTSQAKPPMSTSPELTRGLPSSLTPAPIDAQPDDGITPGRHAPATWDDASRADVLIAAEEAMTDFARPDLDQDTWWAGVEPHLTPEAAQDYAYVLATNVPARQVTGAPILVDDTSAYFAKVKVPTDVGDYVLVLIRESGDSPWLVSRFDPPEGAH